MQEEDGSEDEEEYCISSDSEDQEIFDARMAAKRPRQNDENAEQSKVKKAQHGPKTSSNR